MFAAGALAVVIAGDDDAAAVCFGFGGEFGVAGSQAVVCQVGDIGTVG